MATKCCSKPNVSITTINGRRYEICANCHKRKAI